MTNLHFALKWWDWVYQGIQVESLIQWPLVDHQDVIPWWGSLSGLRNKNPRSFKKYFRCPCMDQDYGQCRYVFDMTCRSTIQKLMVIANTARLRNQVSMMIRTIEAKLKAVSTNQKRTHPRCPKCDHVFENLEAIRTEQQLDPLRRHPTDVCCPECEHPFCTDCLDQNGIPQNFIKNNGANNLIPQQQFQSSFTPFIAEHETVNMKDSAPRMKISFFNYIKNYFLFIYILFK